MAYIENYKTNDNRYKFPKHMIVEKKDSYVVEGGHMNIGENKKNKCLAFSLVSGKNGNRR